MSEIKSVSPEQAQSLLDDVRSEPEFEQGHVPGAVNVPLMHMGPAA
jgi:rhodanese-related sulfurtransferase